MGQPNPIVLCIFCSFWLSLKLPLPFPLYRDKIIFFFIYLSWSVCNTMQRWAYIGTNIVLRNENKYLISITSALLIILTTFWVYIPLHYFFSFFFTPTTKYAYSFGASLHFALASLAWCHLPYISESVAKRRHRVSVLAFLLHCLVWFHRFTSI